MQLKPNELPDMVEDEVRRVTINLAGAIGANSIQSATATSDTLTIGTVTTSGATAAFNVTASAQGTHYILASAVLDSGETVKGYIRAKVTGQPCEQADDYDE